MRVMLGLIAAMLWVTPAIAADWFLVGRSTRTALFVDRDSIADLGENRRRATVYQVFSESDDDGTAAYEPVIEYDCAGLRYRFIGIKSLDINGNMLRNDVGTGQWREIEAQSLDDRARQFVCESTEQEWVEHWGPGPLIARGRALFD